MRERKKFVSAALGLVGIGAIGIICSLSNSERYQEIPQKTPVVFQATPSVIEQDYLTDYTSVRSTQEYVLVHWDSQDAYLREEFPKKCFESAIQIDLNYTLWPDHNGGGSGNVLDIVEANNQAITIGSTARHVLDPSIEVSEFAISRPIDPKDSNTIINIDPSDLHTVTFTGWDISIWGIRGDLRQIVKAHVGLENINFDKKIPLDYGYAVGFPRGEAYSYIIPNFVSLGVYGAFGLKTPISLSTDGQYIVSAEASLNGASGSGICTKDNILVGFLSRRIVDNSDPLRDGNEFEPAWSMREERFNEAISEIITALSD